MPREDGATKGEPSPHSGEMDDLITQLKERQYDAIKHTIDNQRVARAYQRRHYNERAKEKGFATGDRVYLYRPAVKTGDASKLTSKWEPGYVVERRLGNELTYEVRKPGSGKPAERAHVNRLKPQTEAQIYRESQKTAKAFTKNPHERPAASPKPTITIRHHLPPLTDDSSDDDIPTFTDPLTRPRVRFQMSNNTHEDVPTESDQLVTSSPQSDSSTEEDTLRAEATPRKHTTEVSSEEEAIYSEIAEIPAAPRRSTRVRRPPVRYTPPQ